MAEILETWATTEMARFCLVLARITGVVVALPLAWTFAPVRIRVAFALTMTFLMHGALPKGPTAVGELGMLALSLFSEVGIGLSVGFVARLSLAIAEIAADAVAPAMGLAAAQMFDPTLGGQGTVLTKLLRYIALVVALTTGFHHIVIRALFESFRVIPAGALQNPGALAEDVQSMVAETLVSGVTLAMPFLAVLIIAQVGLAFVARAAPQMQIFSVGFAVTLGVGALLWITFAPDVIFQLAFQTERVSVHLEQILSRMGDPP
jgi:flagellar biosynthesis protein FliR